jgi:hypothetical protein
MITVTYTKRLKYTGSDTGQTAFLKFCLFEIQKMLLMKLQMTFFLNQKDVFDLQTVEDIDAFEEKLKILYRVEKSVPCNVFDTASYKLFIHKCKRALLIDSNDVVSAYLHENYKIVFDNKIVKLYRIEKVLPKHMEDMPRDVVNADI